MTTPNTEGMSEMPRTLNAKQTRPDTRAILQGTLWVLLLVGAMLFIAFAGHI